MNKYTSKNYTVLNLVELLKKHEESLFKGDSTRKSITALEAEEKRLLESADIDDEKVLEQIKDVRLKKEVALAAVAKGTNRNEAALQEIKDECRECINGMKEVLDAKANECITLIAGQLSGFFVERYADAFEEARGIFKSTNLGIKYNKIYNYLNTEGLDAKAPIFKANEIFRLSKMVVLLNVTLEEKPDKVPIWGETQKIEDMQAAELEHLLTPMGREERVQLIMNAGNNTRETAETSVDGRIELLKREIEAPANPRIGGAVKVERPGRGETEEAAAA